MNKNSYCVILAGGGGVSLWPLGREEFPKQFITIPWRGMSFLQRTYERFKAVIPQENIIVITLRKYADKVREQLPDLAPENLLLEPYSRKTAPCVAYASYTILKRNPEAVVVVTPCDHIISSDAQFKETMEKVMAYAYENDNLVNIGARPDRPSADFGYIQARGGRKALQAGTPVPVKTFLEKPGTELAEQFIKSGEFLWNTGIFVSKASVIRAEMERYIPEITSLFNGWEKALGGRDEEVFLDAGGGGGVGAEVFLERVYTECSNQSIDYGVMEKTERAVVYPASFSWSDISSWSSLYNASPVKDGSGNIVYFDGKIVQDCKDNLIYCKGNGRMIAVRGLKNYVVVDTEDALLICPREGDSFDDLLSDLAMPDFKKYR